MSDNYEHDESIVCPKCSKRTVEWREIDEVYGDCRYRCTECGYSWITEGPDA